MSTLAIVYETKYGQARKIAEHIGELARGRGHDASVMSVTDVDLGRMGKADACVVVAPVYLGAHPPATARFIVQSSDVLNERVSAFVSVSGSAGSARPADRERAHHIADEFLSKTPWRPNLIRTVGGAIAYPRYGFFTRLMMRIISKREGGPTDTSRTHELTDWHAVERLTRDLLSFLAPTSGRRVDAPAPTQPVS
jgi:menaquinone-dependent protoporphyrinogen oxidase